MKLRRGFTLVELMVVVGITLILSGIGFVVARQAVKRSRVTACASNLSSIGKAMMLYAADHNDEIPGYVTKSVTLPSGLLVEAKCEELTSAYVGYGLKAPQWKCPLDRFPAPYYLPRINTERPDLSSYATSVSLWTALDPVSGRLNLQSVPEPTKLSYLADLKIEYGVADLRTGHGKSGNALYFDGHVKESPIIVTIAGGG